MITSRKKPIFKMCHKNPQSRRVHWGGVCGLVVSVTHLALPDAGVDGVEEVRPVLIAFGQLCEFSPQELALVVAHHPLEGWVDIL